MISEQFVTAIETSDEGSKKSGGKNAGIHLHESKPGYEVRSTFQKSSSPLHGLALSSTHIYAAQSEKALINVYSRAKGNQEAVISFQEKIKCVEFFGDNGGAGFLILGTDGGRLLLWEVHSGRLIATTAAHLQEVSVMAIDTPGSALLTGSADTHVQVWSMASLLSFSPSADFDSQQLTPLRTFRGHRARVTALSVGHSSFQCNIAISTSEGKDCLLWNYATGDTLQTFLLESNPLTLALDPCDRACYVGFEDGSVQLLDFFKISSTSAYSGSSRGQMLAPKIVQSTSSDRWYQPPEVTRSPILSMAVTCEGVSILTGHTDGRVSRWDVATGSCITLNALPGPVTNVRMLPLVGLQKKFSASLQLGQVVKPRYDTSVSLARGNEGGSAAVPYNYSVQARFFPLPALRPSSFSRIFFDRSIPSEELLFNQSVPTPVESPQMDSSDEVASLREKLSSTDQKQAALWKRMVELQAENTRLRGGKV